MTSPTSVGTASRTNAGVELLSLDAGAALIQAQAQLESEKGALVRVLHDDLGGLLVSASMDLSSLSQRPDVPMTVGERLARVNALLRSAIELKRTLIEELQPSLLQNIGLMAALHWYVKRTCDAAGVVCIETYPVTEPVLASPIKITVFRLVQQSVEYLLGGGSMESLSIDVKIRSGELQCRLVSERSDGPTGPMVTAETLFKTSMHYRTLSIGGQFNLSLSPLGQEVDVRIPLASS